MEYVSIHHVRKKWCILYIDVHCYMFSWFIVTTIYISVYIYIYVHFIVCPYAIMWPCGQKFVPQPVIHSGDLCDFSGIRSRWDGLLPETQRDDTTEAPAMAGLQAGLAVGHFHSSYPLVMTNIAMERSTIFNGKIHYFDGPFSIAILT